MHRRFVQSARSVGSLVGSEGIARIICAFPSPLPDWTHRQCHNGLSAYTKYNFWELLDKAAEILDLMPLLGLRIWGLRGVVVFAWMDRRLCIVGSFLLSLQSLYHFPGFEVGKSNLFPHFLPDEMCSQLFISIAPADHLLDLQPSCQLCALLGPRLTSLLRALRSFLFACTFSGPLSDIKLGIK